MGLKQNSLFCLSQGTTQIMAPVISFAGSSQQAAGVALWELPWLQVRLTSGQD